MAYRITEDCAACGTCLPECPVGAISEGDIYKIDPDACIDCGTCADACPMGAIGSAAITVHTTTYSMLSFLAEFMSLPAMTTI